MLQRTGRLTCEACDFDFEERYGKLGLGFAECHHRLPIARLSVTLRTRLSDLAIVCANCHRMIHRSRPLLTVEELRHLVSSVRDAGPDAHARATARVAGAPAPRSSAGSDRSTMPLATRETP